MSPSQSFSVSHGSPTGTVGLAFILDHKLPSRAQPRENKGRDTPTQWPVHSQSGLEGTVGVAVT